MIEVKESRDEAKILSFIEGAGVRRRVSQGTDSPANPVEIVRNKDNHFILAFDNENVTGSLDVIMDL